MQLNVVPLGCNLSKIQFCAKAVSHAKCIVLPDTLSNISFGRDAFIDAAQVCCYKRPVMKSIFMNEMQKVLIRIACVVSVEVLGMQSLAVDISTLATGFCLVPNHRD